MKKFIYLCCLFAGIAAPCLGLHTSTVQAAPTLSKAEGLTAASGKLYFADLMEQQRDSGLIAAHYSHRSHQSHQSHSSHYSSRF